ncbi:response regulator [Alkalimonas amylolytica]|uniref:CheY chemotaxis protein or a CheY-like REC (Receiver) domain n=1 Tax=Alkalimonas amylolytica TaxID=152573 RepID=A0A1H4F6Z4_ALKAM|nr:response regulator [Alkalimonas amylolytica]SEA93084.1 CheY chemotaxis protein or a CheY-like REC (receiver) domain [Alkalimonas amylolytica]
MTDTIRLILAEDDDFLRQLLQMQCEAHGAEVAAVTNGEEAVSLALSYEYDVLLMDIQMPVCDGIQAMTLLRQLGYDRPIYAMSADNITADGFTGVLQKPLQEADLQQLFQQHSPKPSVALVIAPELMQQFLQSLPQLQQQLDHCCQQQNWPELQRLSHKLAGSAGSFGYPAASERAKQLQLALMQQAPSTVIEHHLTQLNKLLQEAMHD